MSILDVKGLQKNFGKLKVLKNVSFSLEKGQMLSIIGPSGGGKTTLLRCLNFLEQPSGGQILVSGKTVFDADGFRRQTEREICTNRRHFGLVFQNFNLFPQYSAIENVKLAAELLAKEHADFTANKKQILEKIEQNAHDLLSQMGLSNRENHYPHELSGGQQQRVAIARALALSPDILCFDEPTSALDLELIGEVLAVIKNLSAKNMTMIIVTHEIRFAREVSDRAIFMDNGTIVEQGSSEEVFCKPKNQRTAKFLERYV